MKVTSGFRRCVALVVAIGLSSLGCGSREGASEALDRALKSTNTAKLRTAKFAGTVTVDGQPPGIKLYGGHRIVVMLYDPKDPPSSEHNILFAECLPEPKDGAFEFSTYERADGVPPGHYIVLFGDYDVGFSKGPHGQDGFKNRFNDPDKNEKDSKFSIDITEPGRTDWQFNLVTENNPPPAAPGPKTVLVPTKK